jgi:hypothetical protein
MEKIPREVDGEKRTGAVDRVGLTCCTVLAGATAEQRRGVEKRVAKNGVEADVCDKGCGAVVVGEEDRHSCIYMVEATACTAGRIYAIWNVSMVQTWLGVVCGHPVNWREERGHCCENVVEAR